MGGRESEIDEWNLLVLFCCFVALLGVVDGKSKVRIVRVVIMVWWVVGDSIRCSVFVRYFQNLD